MHIYRAGHAAIHAGLGPHQRARRRSRQRVLRAVSGPGVARRRGSRYSASSAAPKRAMASRRLSFMLGVRRPLSMLKSSMTRTNARGFSHGRRARAHASCFGTGHELVSEESFHGRDLRHGRRPARTRLRGRGGGAAPAHPRWMGRRDDALGARLRPPRRAVPGHRARPAGHRTHRPARARLDRRLRGVGRVAPP